MIIPGKVYAIVAAGRTIVAVTSRDGEIARHARQYHCGIVAEPGDRQHLADQLRRLYADHEQLDMDWRTLLAAIA